MASYDPWRSQNQTPAGYEDYRSQRTRAGQPLPSNPQPYNSAAPSIRSQARGGGVDAISSVSAPRRSFETRSVRPMPSSPSVFDEKRPLGMRHSDSTGTLAEEYENSLDKGFKEPKGTRGSMAVQMAATGEIPKKAGLRLWRSEEHSGTFLRGGKKRACLRCSICSFLLAILIIIAVVVAFLLWVRPPQVTFQGIETPAGITEVVVITGGFQINFNLLVGVINPNYFGAFFPAITAEAYYPGDSTGLGGGQMLNVDIHKRTNNTIHFPFQINYTSAIDPQNVILIDIADRCGFIQGAQTGPIKVDYSLSLKIRVLAVDITTSFSSSTTFGCPLQESDINTLLQAAGVQGIIQSGNTGTDSANGGGDRKRDLEGVLHGLAERTTGIPRRAQIEERHLDFMPEERAWAVTQL